MTETIARPVVKNKMWIVEAAGEKVATILAVEESGGFVYVHDNKREMFPSIKLLSKKYNIEFVKADNTKKEKIEANWSVCEWKNTVAMPVPKKSAAQSAPVRFQRIR